MQFFLNLGPIFRALMRQRFSAILVVVQIAITMAIITNGLAITWERFLHIERHTGIDEHNTFFLTSSGFTQGFNPRATIENDLSLIRATNGVIDAVQTNSFPLSDSGNWYELQTTTDKDAALIPAASYKFDEHGINTFGLTLVAGENFSAQDTLWLDEADSQWPSHVLISQATASALFGEAQWQTAVGKTLFVNQSTPLIIKGIVKRLHAPWVDWPHVEKTIISPARVTHNSARYVIRTQPGRLNDLMQSLSASLAKENTQRVIRKVKSIQQAKDEIYAADIATVSILLVVIVVLAFVTAMGVAGLASFNIDKRRQQIGIRRALGASKGQILQYFMLENALLCAIGAVLGVLLTFMLNIFLVDRYSLTPLPLLYVPIGVLILLFISQLAVIKPAVRAMSVSPAMATRSL
ncbi:FtsX-like permease family protein [Paraglaciecola agarilytica]|uniref:ABC transporter permease n=1 Tax=Paraglaciecola chathamensis TaxID=368405 RepID=UPI001C08D18B|nr:FtsX-like permease family protein [Paraglaciecola agarilytica]MBU3019969.1 FtsX-like permease family protein [Paraglaciecola agarilytica]